MKVTRQQRHVPWREIEHERILIEYLQKEKRIRIQYRYPGDNAVLAFIHETPPLLFSYGIQLSKGMERNVLVDEWQLPLGPLNVKRANRTEDGALINVDGEIAEYYRKIDDMQVYVQKQIQTRFPNMCKNFTRVIRASTAAMTNMEEGRGAIEHQLLRTRLTQPVSDNDVSRTLASMTENGVENPIFVPREKRDDSKEFSPSMYTVFRSRDKVMTFEEARSRSMEAKGVCFIVFGSVIFVNQIGHFTFRQKEIHMVKMGHDPLVRAETVFDTSHIQYEEEEEDTSKKEKKEVGSTPDALVDPEEPAAKEEQGLEVGSPDTFADPEEPAAEKREEEEEEEEESPHVDETTEEVPATQQQPHPKKPRVEKPHEDDVAVNQLAEKKSVKKTNVYLPVSAARKPRRN